ncbi:hypothetical protein M2271_006829 [Streptomyces sp. LBL]|uniref:hypothetical protein n=1 Tax=Streptomyces sp. LBL TaxID=2940562 RepID=UPI00247360DA|nr:hypothetical protein [Streptomyces sp. LBL]MDH6628994.1 hypothetical protein [Streptomyces sp. LBL]
MHARGRTLKFTAVLALVVLALTGFSTGRHGHRSGSDSGGGGGCSSSSQDHDSSSSSSSSSGGGSYGSGSDDDSYSGSSEDSYGSGSGGNSGSSGGSSYQRRPTYRSTPTASGTGSSKPLKDGTARLISCATDTRPYATVEITNPNNREAEFQARVTFYDAEGTQLLKNSSSTVTVPAQGKATTRVKLGERFLTSVDHCAAEPEAEVRD